MKKEKANRFFVYEGKDLVAAQPTFNGAMRYFKKGRKMYTGTPIRHKIDVTNVANKINKWNDK